MAYRSGPQMPLDVDALGCDMLLATSREFLCGPCGTSSSMCAESGWNGSTLPSSTFRIAEGNREDTRGKTPWFPYTASAATGYSFLTGVHPTHVPPYTLDRKW